MTNATIFCGTPNSIMFCIARGKAESEEAVEKASKTGSATSFPNCLRLILQTRVIGIKTHVTKMTSPRYKERISFPNDAKIPIPDIPIAAAMAPKTAGAANFMTILTAENMISDRDLLNCNMVTLASLCGVEIIDMEKITAITTIAKISPRLISIHQSVVPPEEEAVPSGLNPTAA